MLMKDPGWLKIFLTIGIGIAFINEYLIYLVQTNRWPSFPHIDRDSGHYQVLLVVGDPQIQGYQDEMFFPIGTLARWDADRYLKKMFNHAYTYSEPDVVLFLGDLMDEGSKATPREYAQTLERFFDIFEPVKFVKTIYIPGDNDIGGEGKDFTTARKLDRFHKNFGNSTDMIKFGFIDFAKLDLPTHGLTEQKVHAAEHMKLRQTSPITVLLNHQTLLIGAKHFVHPIFKRLKPKVVLSAHWHKARIFNCEDCLKEDEYSWSVSTQDLTFMDSYSTLDLSGAHSMCEISVPTCSYRMGVPDIGYVVLIIGNDSSVEFTVLWLPRRYTLLLSYFLVVMICATVYTVYNCKCGRR